MKRTDVAVLLAAIAGGVAARLITHFALGDVPHVMDEIAYWLQARMIAEGRVAVAPHLPRAAFAMWFVDDRWATYSIFPPGWPAVLALGAKVGVGPWVNPLLHVLTVPFVGRAARGLGGGERGRIAAAFAYALSPQALLLAGSFMSHALVALGAAVALSVAIDAWDGRARPAELVAGGASLGLVLLARPLCGVALALGLAALLAPAFFRRHIGMGAVLTFIGPVVLSTAILGAYNARLTHDALRFPQTSWFDEHVPPIDITFFRYQPGCNALGFGPGHGCDYGILHAGHTPANALSNTGDNLTSWVMLAGGGPLVFLGVLLALRKRAERGARGAALAVIPITIGLYSLYWYAGTCYGARFYQAALPALLVLATLGLVEIEARWLRASLAVAWVCLSAAGLYAGLREVNADYWGSDARYLHFVEGRSTSERALYLVAFREDGVPMRHLRVTGFTTKQKDPRWMNSVRALAALSMNDPDLAAPTLFAKYHPQMVDALRARFPDRALYIYVVDADPAKDEVVRYDGSRYADEDRVGVYPRDNFDGYVVQPAPSP